MITFSIIFSQNIMQHFETRIIDNNKIIIIMTTYKCRYVISLFSQLNLQNINGRYFFRPNFTFFFSPKYDTVNSSFRRFIITLFLPMDSRSKFWRPCRKFFFLKPFCITQRVTRRGDFYYSLKMHALFYFFFVFIEMGKYLSYQYIVKKMLNIKKLLNCLIIKNHNLINSYRLSSILFEFYLRFSIDGLLLSYL